MAAAAQDWQEQEVSPSQPQQGVATTVIEQEQQQQQDQYADPKQQQQQQAQQLLQPHQYSPLHYDIQKFVQRVVPTDQEKAEKQRIIQA